MTAARSSGWSCSTSTASEAPAAPPSARTAAVSAKTGAATGTARPRALAELARRHPPEWHQRYTQLRAAHPDWLPARAFMVATTQQRRAHRQEYLALLAGYAGARRAGPKLVYKITRRAQRLLQLAHPAEYQAL